MDIIQLQDCGTFTDIPKEKGTKSKSKEKCTEGSVKDDSQFQPVEKKKKLKKKLQEICETNETLAKSISEKNEEIVNLKRSVQSLNEVLNSVPIDELRCNSSIASTKILELSKKNRQLRAELETTKHRANTKDAQIQKLEHALKQVEEKLSQGDIEPQPRRGVGKNFSPIDELKSKLNTMQQKLFETRNRNAELQNQLKMTQKCLQQEVGEGVNVAAVSFSSTQQQGQPAWRGRAQQILNLQQKIQELKNRLESYEHSSSARGSYAPTSDPASATIDSPKGAAEDYVSNLTSTGNAAYDRFTPGIRRTELLHRTKVEALEKEIASLKGQLDENRTKILALKVRNKTLNEDVVKFKVKAISLEEQTSFNGMNLATMNDKLNMQKRQYEARLEQMVREVAEAMRQRETVELKEEETRNKFQNMVDLLASKEENIQTLNEVVAKLETDLKAVSGGFLFSCRELRKDEFVAILDSLETEKNLLLGHNRALNERIKEERNRNENLSEQVNKQKIRIARSEAKIRELEKELELQSDRKKRSNRIAEYAHSVSTTSLNTAIGSFVFENPSITSFSDNNKVSGLPNEGVQLAELQNQLELASEKIILLEEKIRHLCAEKENDARTFEETIMNSKDIILDKLLQHKAKSLNSKDQDNGKA